MTRIARTVAFSLLIAFVPVVAAQADEVVGSEIAVPTAVVIEEVVTAAPPAFVDLESTSVGAGLGFGWGTGTLSFEGQQYSFSVKEFGVGELGVASLTAEGGVENLTSASDLAGHYVAVGAGATLGKGASTVIMRNSKGVTLSLQADTTGAQLPFVSTKGVTIEMH